MWLRLENTLRTFLSSLAVSDSLQVRSFMLFFTYFQNTNARFTVKYIDIQVAHFKIKIARTVLALKTFFEKCQKMPKNAKKNSHKYKTSKQVKRWAEVFFLMVNIEEIFRSVESIQKIRKKLCLNLCLLTTYKGITFCGKYYYCVENTRCTKATHGIQSFLLCYRGHLKL